MRDLIFALGAILAAEGFLLAIAPDRMERLMETMRLMGPERLRYAGLLAAALGVGLIALAH
ncbi:MAG: hypothetical protein CML46_07420 [Rhodobacteraceae bacterium]|nr:hypothetical protein [Paracoccaceae bacterium]MBR26756.1 hypothetical protein [Paracoccaceae bacterium]